MISRSKTFCVLALLFIVTSTMAEVEEYAMVFTPDANHQQWINATAIEEVERLLGLISEKKLHENHHFDDDEEVHEARKRALLRRKDHLLSKDTAPLFNCKGNHCHKTEYIPRAIVCRSIFGGEHHDAFHDHHDAVESTRRSFLQLDYDISTEMVRPKMKHSAADSSDAVIHSPHWVCAVLRNPLTPPYIRTERIRIECQHGEVNMEKSQSDVVSKFEGLDEINKHMTEVLGERGDAVVEDSVDAMGEATVEVVDSHGKVQTLQRKCRVHFNIVNHGPFKSKLGLVFLVIFVVAFVVIMTFFVGSKSYKEEVAKARVNKEFSSWIKERGLGNVMDRSKGTPSVVKSAMAPTRVAMPKNAPILSDEQKGRYSLPPELQEFAQAGSVFSQTSDGLGFNVFDNPEGLSLGQLRTRASKPTTTITTQHFEGVGNPRSPEFGRNRRRVVSTAVNINEGMTFDIDGL